MSIIQDLKSKKKKITEIQSENERRIGARDAILEQIKKNFDVSNIEEAKILIEELNKELKIVEDESNELVEKLDKIIKQANEAT